MSKFKSCAGSKFKTLFSPVVGKDGTIDLVESGKINIAEQINSYRDQTDISVILARVNAGDTSVLNQVQGVFGDFTSMPRTYAEFLQLQIDAHNMFDKLTPDERSRFGNDFNQFFAQAGSPEWLEKFGVSVSASEEKESEVSV